MSATAPNLEALQVDVDTRTLELWELFWGSELDQDNSMVQRQFGAFLRAAYIRGYNDRARELGVTSPGRLATDNDYPS